MMQSSIPRLQGLDVSMPPLAPVALLAFLGAGFLLAVFGVGAAVAFAARRHGPARILSGGALAVASVYSVALVAASLLSRERTLAAGEKKYFCEMDCHLAYSVVRSSREGGMRAVTVRTWFDPNTISPRRGDAPLTPNPREVYLEVSPGRRVFPSGGATVAWRKRHGETASLDRSLRPGESYETTFVFEAPERSGPPRLFLGDAPGVERLLIGHESSPLHRQTFFAVPDPVVDSWDAAAGGRSVAARIDEGGRS